MRCICDTGRGWGSAWRFGGDTVVIINRSQQLTTATAMSEITSDSGYGAETPVTPVPQGANAKEICEHATLSPQYLGLEIVITQSFACIQKLHHSLKNYVR